LHRVLGERNALRKLFNGLLVRARRKLRSLVDRSRVEQRVLTKSKALSQEPCKVSGQHAFVSDKTVVSYERQCSPLPSFQQPQIVSQGLHRLFTFLANPFFCELPLISHLDLYPLQLLPEYRQRHNGTLRPIQ